MITGPHQANQQQTTQPSWTMKDLVMGQRIKKMTTHNLFQLTNHNEVFVAKLFKPQFHHNYQLELGNLRQLNHPNIINVMYHQCADTESTGYSNCDMLVFKWAEHGSLNEYIPMNGRLPQAIARVIFVQMISALKYASLKQPNGIIHPNVLPSNILLDSDHNVKVCGWSGQCEKKERKLLIQEILFGCCQILILMLTGYMPFFKKDPKCDPLFRYIRPQHIGKFWQLFQKRVVSKHKQFQFSPQVKQLISNVFLKQWTTFQQIQKSQWWNLPKPTHEQYIKFLTQHQQQALLKRETLVKKQQQRANQKRRMLLEYQQQTQHGSNSRSSEQYDIFIQDYYDNCYNEQDVPAHQQCSELIKLYDDRPNFVIASLKQHLRHLEQSDVDWIFGGEFMLQSYDFYKEGNQVYLRFIFVQMNEELLDRDEDFQVRVKVVVRFFKNGKGRLLAEVKVLQSSLSQFYASQVMRFVEDKIKMHQT